MKKVMTILSLFIFAYAVSCSKDGGKGMNNHGNVDKYDNAKYNEAKFN